VSGRLKGGREDAAHRVWHQVLGGDGLHILPGVDGVVHDVFHVHRDGAAAGVAHGRPAAGVLPRMTSHVPPVCAACLCRLSVPPSAPLPCTDATGVCTAGAMRRPSRRRRQPPPASTACAPTTTPSPQERGHAMAAVGRHLARLEVQWRLVCLLVAVAADGLGHLHAATHAGVRGLLRACMGA